MKKLLTERTILVIAGILILLGFIFSTITAVRTFTLKPGEETVISGGTTVKKPTNNIVDASLTDDGYLLVKYEDGTTKQVGYILGEKGDKGDSIPPTQAQIAIAVTNYCQENNRCDAKAPTPEQVAAAVTNYCSTRNGCAGPAGQNGADGQNVTDAQVMAAVSQYCSSSETKCKGPTGATGATGAKGDKGDTGDSVIMACVSERDSLGVSRFYVAWGQSSKIANDNPNVVADKNNYHLLYKIDSNDPVKPCQPIA